MRLCCHFLIVVLFAFLVYHGILVDSAKGQKESEGTGKETLVPSSAGCDQSAIFIEKTEAEKQSWLCKFCNQWVKESFEYCGKCGHGWWEKPPKQKAHKEPQRWDWDAWGWQESHQPGHSQSPRSRRDQGPKSPRQQQPPPKSKGKGKKGKGKGKGSGQNPGKGKSKEKGKDEVLPPWAMLNYAAPTPDSSIPMPSTPAPLPPEIQNLLGGLRKAEANLPPDIQGLYQKTMQKTSQQTTKDMHSALHRLGEARKGLQNAKLARVNFHDQWGKYLTQATDRWNGFLKQFQEQDLALAKEQENAMSALKHARQQLELIKEQLQSTDRQLLEESDEEVGATYEEVSRKIRAGVEGMAQSLQELGQRATESMEQLQCEQGRLKRFKAAPTEKVDAMAVEDLDGDEGDGKSAPSAPSAPVTLLPGDLTEVGQGLGQYQYNVEFPATTTWNHSILSQDDFLSTWAAVDIADDLFQEVQSAHATGVQLHGLSAPVPGRSCIRTGLSTKRHLRVRLEPMVTILQGEDDRLTMYRTCMHHSLLRKWPSKPWTGPCSRCDDIFLDEFNSGGSEDVLVPVQPRVLLLDGSDDVHDALNLMQVGTPGNFQAHIYGLYRTISHGRINGSPSNFDLNSAAEIIGCPHSELVALHSVRASLYGDLPHARNFIGELTGDVDPMDPNLPKLIIIEVLKELEHGRLPSGRHTRNVGRVRQWTSRDDILMILRTLTHCRRVQGGCTVLCNDQLWPTSDTRPRRFEHGDVIFVQIPTETSTTHLVCSQSDPPSSPSQACDRGEDEEEEEEEEAATSDDDSVNDEPANAEQPSQEATGTPFLVWYVNHRTHTLCDEPRHVVIPDVLQDWLPAFSEAWQDHYEIGRASRVALVHPQPNSPATSTTRPPIHVILEQGLQHNCIAIIVWHSPAIGSPHPHNTLALSVTAYTAGDLIFRAASLTSRQRYLCRQGHRRLPDLTLELCASGSFITIEPLEADAVDDAVLLQTHRALSTPVRKVLSWHGLAHLLDTSLRPLQWETTDQQTCAVQAPLPQETSNDGISPAPGYASSYSDGVRDSAHPSKLGGIAAFLRLLDSRRPLSTGGTGSTPEPEFVVATYYLSLERQDICRVARRVRLHGPPDQWMAIMHFMWRDFVDADVMLQFYMVFPHPPTLGMHEAVAAHVILLQHPVRDHRAVLDTIVDHPSVYYIAAMVPMWLTHTNLLGRVGYWHRCHNEAPQVTCATWYSNLVLRDHPPLLCEHGFGFVTVLLRAPRPDTRLVALDSHQVVTMPLTSGTEATDPADHTALWQTKLDIKPVVPFPRSHRLEDQGTAGSWQPSTVAIDALQPLGRADRLPWQIEDEQDWEAEELVEVVDQELVHEPGDMYVTWFLHGQRQPFCPHGRDVELSRFPLFWMQQLFEAWGDLIDQAEDFTYFLVRPTPPSNPGDNVHGHVIVVQHVLHHRKAFLASSQLNDGVWTHRAFLGPSIITKFELITACTLQGPCIQNQLGYQCHAAFSDRELQWDAELMAEHGAGFTVRVVRLPPTVDLNAPLDLGLDDTAFWPAEDPYASLLQLPGHSGRQIAEQVAHTQQPEFPLEQNIRVPFQQVFTLFAQFDAHFTLPQYDLAFDVAGHPWTPWLASWWEPGTPFCKLQIYYDGSFFKETGQGGCAAAAFVMTCDGLWHFAGVVSVQPPRAQDSYQAELLAAIIAHKFGFDLLKLNATLGPSVEVNFCFDSTSVGCQTTGHWEGARHKHLVHALRNVRRLLEKAFFVTPGDIHTQGHSGNPGNELVDECARRAAAGTPFHNFDDFFDLILSRDHTTAIAWIWALFDPQLAVDWTTQTWSLPTSPTTTFDVAISTCACTRAHLCLDLRACATLRRISRWWDELLHSIPSRLRQLPFVLLADANCRVGSRTCEHIGPLEADEEDDKASGFTSFIREQNLILPSTFPDNHFGNSHTWFHSSGKGSRIDYIAIPLSWPTTLCRSWVDDDVEVGLLRDDHRPVLLRAAWTSQDTRMVPRRRRAAPRLDVSQMTCIAGPSQCLPWDVDVHTHAEALQRHLAHQVRTGATPSSGSIPRKETMSKDTWDLVQSKRRARLQLSNLNKQHRAVQLGFWFLAWKVRTDAARADLMSKLEPVRYPGQLGGFRAQSSLFAAQGLQTFLRIADARKLNVFVLYLDIATAFHQLLRELVVGVITTPALDHVLTAIQQNEDLALRLQASQELPCLLQRLGASPTLLGLLKNVHFATWCTLDGSRFLHMHRGTRPGSPLADCIFHVLMHEIVGDLAEFLDEHPGLQSLLRTYDLQATTLVWADDVAIPWIALDGASMLVDLADLLRFVHKAFRLRGLPLNFARGKTAATVTFRGPVRDQPLSFVCGCGRGFTTAQGLQLHKWKAHGTPSPERRFLAGATCPVCLRFYWSTQRLQQHLAYMPRSGEPNRCYAALQAAEFQADYFCLPQSQLPAGQRCDYIQGFGPAHPLPSAHAARQTAWRNELETLQATCTSIEQDVPPETIAELFHRALLDAATTWFEDFQNNGCTLVDLPPLEDRWFAVLADVPAPWHAWAEFAFRRWGDSQLDDWIATLCDGEAEVFATDAFCSLSADLPHYDLLQRFHRLRALLAAESDPAVARPHRAIRWGPEQARAGSSSQLVGRLLREQEAWQAHLHTVRWDAFPVCPAIPQLVGPDGTPRFVVVHLFSGRRRPGDVHDCLHSLARDHNIELLVLSVDTAVAPTLGDLGLHSQAWKHLQECYQCGWVSATVIGSPCETFSEARHQPLEEGRTKPRPLRSATRLFGLDGLDGAEYAQLSMGSAFFLQGAFTLASHLTQGGMYISEHPAPPQDVSRATIWRSALLSLMQRHPLVDFTVVPQYCWGAEAVKPTGLLTMNLPRFRRHLWSTSIPDAIRPTEGAIGRTSDGSGFRTGALKEYPSALCRGLATAVVSRLADAVRTGGTRTVNFSGRHQTWSWVEDLNAASTIIRNGSWLPDYQGPQR
eukprot:Skav227937  [mRNA]  locus=scaffold146:464374:475885:- [translate_table: standard]